MEKFLYDVVMGLAWTVVFVAAVFLLLFIARKYRIDWLTRFLTQPPEQGRPPGWIVFGVGALLVILTTVWFLLPAEQRSAIRTFVVGPK